MANLTLYSGDIATPNIKAWRFVFDEGNYWLLTAIQGVLGQLAFQSNWVVEGDATAYAAAVLGEQVLLSLEPTLDYIGMIFPFAGVPGAIPDGTLLCDGSSYLRTNFPDLFSVIGTTYGSVDGTHFNVPDLRGRTVLGVGTGTGLSTYILGQTVGEEAHTLNTSEIPSHSHTVSNFVDTLAFEPGELPVLSPFPGFVSTGSTGGNGSHENRQPSIALNYVISAVH